MNKFDLDSYQPKLVVAVVILFVLLAVMIGIIAFQFGQQTRLTGQDSPPTAAAVAPPRVVTNTPTHTATPAATPTVTPTPSPTFTPTSTPTPTPIVVITHIDSLGRLETAQFSMQTMINLENEPANLWQQVFGTDELMLMAEGEVAAGLDLTKVTEDDIVVEGSNVEITLPAPEILYSRIDNERTQVYKRETGLFVKPDASLESRARQLAEESLIDFAVKRGIYEKARESGKFQIENLLRSLGFDEIVITIEGEDL